MSENRMNDLESKLAHQEHLLEELNQVIYQQQKAIDTMELKLNLLIQRLKDVAGGAGDIGPANEKPPHY